MQTKVRFDKVVVRGDVTALPPPVSDPPLAWLPSTLSTLLLGYPLLLLVINRSSLDNSCRAKQAVVV